jgi:hypothetical protein
MDVIDSIKDYAPWLPHVAWVSYLGINSMCEVLKTCKTIKLFWSSEDDEPED